MSYRIVSLQAHVNQHIAISMDNKLSLISELIKLAKVDGEIKEQEYDFLLTLSKMIGISEIDFNKLLSESSEYNPPDNENDRIVQFYRLVLLSNIDFEVNTKELSHLKDAGLRLGLNLYAVETVLEEMQQNKNGKIPSERLIEIFKVNKN